MMWSLFEELGVDKLFVDEAHGFKNLFLTTKMRNVAGIGQSEAQKSSDMFAKCRYLDDLTGGKGVVFATGTPVSNSMVELYTMMRYLQYDLLKETGLDHFDSWAAAFGETVTALELAPEGGGFRAKTRFAKFFNLPELMAMWKEAADIQTAEMLKLPVPASENITVVTKPSEFQKRAGCRTGGTCGGCEKPLSGTQGGQYAQDYVGRQEAGAGSASGISRTARRPGKQSQCLCGECAESLAGYGTPERCPACFL